MIRSFFRVLLVLWAGSLWATIWVATLVFHVLNDRHQAGVIAGRLFAIETYIGVGVAALALVLPGRTRFVWGYLAAALLALSQWVLAPVMAAPGGDERLLRCGPGSATSPAAAGLQAAPGGEGVQRVLDG